MPGVLIGGIIGHIEVREVSKLQIQILIIASFLQADLKEGHLPFQIMIQEDQHGHVLTATRCIFQPAAGACMTPVPLATGAGGKATVRGTAFRNRLSVLRSGA